MNELEFPIEIEFPIEPGVLTRLHHRLASEAAIEGLLEVAYTIIDTPVGPLMLAATGDGLVRVAYEREGFEGVLQVLAERITPRILVAPERLDDVTHQLEEYFSGARRSFDLRLDRRLSSGFRDAVQRQLPRIDYGHTLSYTQLAEMVGNPKAVRAVGTACATNPLPVVVPCHRVLRSDGNTGGYIGGPEVKKALLTLEGAA